MNRIVSGVVWVYAVAAGGVLALAAASGAAEAQEFYAGKQISLIVGSETGGGYDTYGRLLSRHMGKYLPGHPTIVMQNMPGAGGLRAANHLYNVAAKDGTVIGTFQRNLPLNAILDKSREQIKFEPAKFTWLGSSSSGRDDAYMLVIRSEVPVMSVADLRGPKAHQLIVGATAPGSQSHDLPVVLAEILDLSLKIVPGYPSSSASMLAMQRKETEGRMFGLSALRATHPEMLTKNLVRCLFQFGRITRHPELPEVPTARELAPNDEARAMVEMLEVSQFLSWPYTAPPGIPPERTAILRQAFMATHSDPEYVAEAEKQKMELSPIGGEEITEMLTRLSDLPPSLIARYNQIAAKIKDGK